MKNVTWSSRFTKQMDAEVLEFSQSLNIDIVLFSSDIKVTIAHVDMLKSCGHITSAEKKKIIAGLKKVLALAENGKLEWSIDFQKSQVIYWIKIDNADRYFSPIKS